MCVSFAIRLPSESTRLLVMRRRPAVRFASPSFASDHSIRSPAVNDPMRNTSPVLNPGTRAYSTSSDRVISSIVRIFSSDIYPPIKFQTLERFQHPNRHGTPTASHVVQQTAESNLKQAESTLSNRLGLAGRVQSTSPEKRIVTSAESFPSTGAFGAMCCTCPLNTHSTASGNVIL